MRRVEAKTINILRLQFTIVISLVLLCISVTPSHSQKAPAWTELDCECTTQYDPVCGSDWGRYTNICYFACRNKYLKKNGYQTLLCYDCVTGQLITKETY